MSKEADSLIIRYRAEEAFTATNKNGLPRISKELTILLSESAEEKAKALLGTKNHKNCTDKDLDIMKQRC